jgi:hypothetical protein
MSLTPRTDLADRHVVSPIIDEEFSATLRKQVFENWVEPELARRGGALQKSDVTRALVIMHPDTNETDVRLNEEVELVAEVMVRRDVEAGETIGEADVEYIAGIRPYGIDPDAAFVAFAIIGDVGYVSFDSRRYKGAAQRLLAVARDYLETATEACSAGRLAPAIENGYAAAELVVSVQMRLFDVLTRDHRVRAEWWEAWAQIGNVPAEHGYVLRTLWRERSQARYGEGELTLDTEDVELLLSHTEAMLLSAIASAAGDSSKP